MEHEFLMRRCFELARLGAGKVAPNPLVGSVVAENNEIIGEGYHQQYGEAHAEVNAILSVKEQERLANATIYVNLEPCAHHGKTPPCADLIIEKKLKRVVLSTRDPFDEVNGKGIERLKAAGIEVVDGVLEEEGRWLNRRFFTFHEQKRPHIILKFAQTNDGFLDAYRTNNDALSALKITCVESDKLIHKWRSEEASILVGLNTVTLDNPTLTTRHWTGKNPLRMVIDPRLQIPAESTVLTDGLPTWIFNAIKSDVCEDKVCYIQINNPDSFEAEILEYLYKNDVQSLIIEGGATTLQRFIDANLWDEARIFSSEQRIGSGVPSPHVKGMLYSTETIGSDLLQVYLNQ